MNSQDSGCKECNRQPQWKSDFPVEWEGDHYVSRREMVKFLTLGSLLLACANWVTAFAGKVLRPGSNEERYVGSASALDQMGSVLFRYPTDGDPCIAVRKPDGNLVAYSQVCTHLSCAVVYSKDENKLICPCHRGYFEIEQGRPVAGPPTRPLPRVKLEKRGDKLFATGLEV